MDTIGTRNIFIITRCGILQEAYSALIQEIPKTRVFLFEDWISAENGLSTYSPDLILIEAAILCSEEGIDFIRLIPFNTWTVVLEDSLLFMDKWREAGADLVVLIGESVPNLYSNIASLLSQSKIKKHIKVKEKS